MEALIRDLVSWGPQLNREWMASAAGRASFLSFYMLGPNRDKFVETNCDTTAMMLRTKLSPAHTEYEWTVSTVPPPNDCKVFQVSLGSDWTDVEHIFTVVGNSVLHSWYGKHRLLELTLDSSAIQSLMCPETAIHNILGIIEHLYDVLPERQRELKVFYWVPPQPK